MRVGIIGYGVRVDMMIDAFLAADPDFKIVAITDINQAKVKALLDQSTVSEEALYEFGLDKIDANLRKCKIDANEITFYTDADEMMDKEQLDGVIVGTACNTHAMFAAKVMKRNLPLFLEKPVGITEDDLKLLKSAYQEYQSDVVVSFPLRTTLIVNEVKRLIDSGVIGKVDQVQAFNDVPYGFVYFHDWYRDEKKANGLFLQKATHDLDVINYLVGETPIEICAMSSKQLFKGDMPAGLRCKDCEKEKACTESSYYIKTFRNDIPRNDYCCYAVDTGNQDSGSVIVRYESGMHAIYSQNFFARKKAGRRGARLYGYKGTIEFDYAKDTITVFDHMSDKVTTINVGTPRGGHGGGDRILARNFVNVMRGAERSIAPLDAGILSALVCLKATASAQNKQFYDIKL